MPAASLDLSAVAWYVVLGSVLGVAAFVLLRPFIAAPGRRGEVLAVVLAATAGAGDWLLAGAAGAAPPGWVPLAGSAAFGVVLWQLVQPSGRLAGALRRAAPGLALAGATLSGAAAAVLWFGDTEAASLPLAHGALLIACAASAWFVLCHPTRLVAVLAIRGTAAVLAISTLALLAELVSAGPVPGVPLLGSVALGDGSTRILVVPHRPGWNLVQVEGDDDAVGTGPDTLATATTRPGAAGAWAPVWLPPGRGQLWIRRKGSLATLAVNTGHRPASLDLSGPDGPECASAALGGLIAGSRQPLLACPSDRLTAEESVALRGLVGFVAARGVSRVTLVTDSSRRSASAAEVVRQAAATGGLTLLTPEHPAGPVLIVSGWAAAAGALRRVATGALPAYGGSYLAPWLLAGQLLEIPAAQLLPLRYSPATDAEPARYAATLAARFPPAGPTASGYAAWLAAGKTTASAPYRLFASSTVNPWLTAAPRHDHGGQRWLPAGAIAPVSGPLPGQRP
ncbi:MAG TPA: DUF6239 family natural product biosynthesis protein [Actinophytocola sp.]|uniref:DUF6239 family natural product biosynthesis protein n=1 Tax=Actinophytocola sp. TaxID=1872138 RepID=UPI002DFD8092|nr:DUF6239 family natural product biosynthesis protein [Actinophytocola sp.]